MGIWYTNSPSTGGVDKRKVPKDAAKQLTSPQTTKRPQLSRKGRRSRMSHIMLVDEEEKKEDSSLSSRSSSSTSTSSSLEQPSLLEVHHESKVANKEPSLPKPSKRVQFDMDKNGEVKCENFYSSHPLSGRDKQKMWWTTDEQDIRKDRAFALVGEYKDRTGYIQDYYEIFTACAQAEDEDDFDQEHLCALAHAVVKRRARGLEMQILAVLDRYRTKYSEAVLLTQDAVYDCADVDKRWEILAERCAQFSRPGRILARVVGIADANVVER